MPGPKIPRPGCPKRMAYGPCGGVAPDLGCEVAPLACPFVAAPATTWPESGAASFAPRAVVPALIADVRIFPGEAARVDGAIACLRPHVDAALVGDHVADRDDAPPEWVAPRVAATGIDTIATLACRGRTRAAYGEAVERLLDAGVTTVLCVTGDHPAALRGAEHRTGRAQEEFVTESLECIGAARERGASVAVAESPGSPPGTARVTRLARKVDAGAQICFVNHCADPRTLLDFVAAARADGVTLPFVAPIPAVTDSASGRSLEHLPGMNVPAPFEPGAVARASADPHADAQALVTRLGADNAFAAYNLSGRAHAGDLDARCRAMADLAGAVRASAWPS